MSVIGIDFGNESCYVAAAKAGGIETLSNDYTLRATPSCVSFAGKQREAGNAAENQIITNMKNTVYNFKRLLGKKFNDPQVQSILRLVAYRSEERPDGGIGIRVNYLENEHVFTPEQITAMLLTKLKQTSQSALQAQVKDCVIACPVFFTNNERKALLDAAAIANLNVLRLMNETTAVALTYGFYRKDLPGVDEPSHNVVFVDFGNASLQVSAVAFNNGKLKMLASAWDQIGGRDFNALLAEHFANEYAEQKKFKAPITSRPYLRLLGEVERLKKQMSANSTKLPIQSDCFYEEECLSSRMQRSEMEEMCSHLLERCEKTLRKCLKDSRLNVEDIHTVEIVGGSTRIPAVKAMIEQIFGKQCSTTLNQDEAVSRGAALMCAIMSPAMRVKDFGVIDIQNYPVKASWDNDNGQKTEMEVFPAMHVTPFSRMLTLYRREPFAMQLSYADPSPIPDPLIGIWQINDIKPSASGETQEIKIKVRINHNGVVMISNASMVEKKDAADDTPADDPAAADGQTEQMDGVQEGNCADSVNSHQHSSNQPDQHNDNGDGGDQTPQSTGAGWAQRVKGWFSSGDDGKNGKKKSAKKMELAMVVKTPGFTVDEVQRLFEEEEKMISQDTQERERVDARNEFESLGYSLRDEFGEGGKMSAYAKAQDREQICAQIQNMLDWLYEDGDDCERDVYRAKLAELAQLTNAVRVRATEHESFESEFRQLAMGVDYGRKLIAEYRSGSEKFNHLSEAEMITVDEALANSSKWLESARVKCRDVPKTADLPVKVADVANEWQNLKKCVDSVFNRQKPKVQPPPPAPETKPNNGEEKKDEPSTIDDEMDVE